MNPIFFGANSVVYINNLPIFKTEKNPQKQMTASVAFATIYIYIHTYIQYMCVFHVVESAFLQK